MGLSSSLPLTATEGEHFSVLINPTSVSPAAVASNPQSRTSRRSASALSAARISPKAVILKRISFEKLWDSFLSSSTATSFALPFSEVTQLLTEASLSNNQNDKEKIEGEIKSYLELVTELTEKGAAENVVDFLGLCASSLLLNQGSVESKADLLFEWISLDDDDHPGEFSYEQFLIAMTSFERGLSHAMGKPACSEAYVRGISTQWMALADPKHKGSADIKTKINSKDFFDFCTNRQHVVRRLLECLATADIAQDEIIELQEVTDLVDGVLKSSGGDQWLANPAWKKTAQRMVPKDQNYGNSKPSSTLSLEWVHGYRGFDCRNNLRYANTTASQIIFSAAGLTVVQDNQGNLEGEDKASQRTQSFFGEHADDIISLSAFVIPESPGRERPGSLIATGEIGKSPSIYIYFWSERQKDFESLGNMSGFHKKGIAQLEFSLTGKNLFSVGVEYTVAIYNTEYDPALERGKGKLFGKMTISSQGPKSNVFCACHLNTDTTFLTCGEKHVISWQIEKNGTLKQEQCRLGVNRNKTFMSVVSVRDPVAPERTSLAVLSSSDGDLLLLADSNVHLLEFKNPPHSKKCINALWANAAGNYLVSGGKDGSVYVWHFAATAGTGSAPYHLEQVGHFSIFGFSMSSSEPSVAQSSNILKNVSSSKTDIPAIRSVCLNSDGSKLLVGTQSCEILEYSMTSAKSFLSKSYDQMWIKAVDLEVMQCIVGHHKHELWGLAVRPITEENRYSPVQYCTVGDDGFLRVWNVKSHAQILCLSLKGVARTCAYTPDGNYLAIGFGGSLGRGKNKEDGVVRIYRFEYGGSVRGKGFGLPVDLTQVTEIKEAKAWISVVKYSPDGTLLAVGSRDNSIYLYSVMQQYKRKAKFSKHNSGINQLDFTADGKYLQSCCSSYEILFSETNKGTQVTNGATQLSDARWHSWTCTLGWPVIGVWSGNMDGTDINAVDRSPSQQLLATADDFGAVKVFRYPAVQEGGSEHAAYSGHSSHVTCVRWVSLDSVGRDDYLISTGGDDKCIFQWRLPVQERSSGGRCVEKAVTDFESLEIADFDLPSGGDEFMAVKPWLGAIVAPTAWAQKDPMKLHPFRAALGELTNQHQRLAEEIQQAVGEKSALAAGSPLSADIYRRLYSGVRQAAELTCVKMSESGSEDASAPDSDELQLQWVCGYRGFDNRNNTFYLSVDSGRLVIYYAAALGIVLDPVSRTQRFFRGHTDDILSMAMYASAGIGNTAVIATGQQGKAKTFVWEVPSMKTLAVLQTGQKSVSCLGFSNDGRLLVSIAEDKTVSVMDWQSQTVLCLTTGDGSVTHHLVGGHKPSTNFDFLTVGDKSIRYWNLSGRNLTSTKVSTINNKECSLQPFWCVARLDTVFLIGCDDGSIYVVTDCSKGVKSVFTHHLYQSLLSSESVPAAASLKAPAAASSKAPLKAAGGKKKSTGGGGGGVSGGNVKAKGGPAVTAMHMNVASQVLVTGAKDGSVVVWDASSLLAGSSRLSVADIKCYFSIDSIGVQDIHAKQIQSLFFCPMSPVVETEEMLLVIGTRGCDLLEVCCSPLSDPDQPHMIGRALLYSAAKAEENGLGLIRKVPPSREGILNRSHCNDELWGVSTHPSLPQYCTVGDDKTLRFYDVLTRSCLKIVPLGIMSRSVCYSPDGSIVALGFGGRVGRGDAAGGGTVRLYSSNTTAGMEMDKLAECKDAKQWISDVKFSADGSTLAIGAHDCKIYLYDVKINSADGKGGKLSAVLSLRTKFCKHNSVINHLDISRDGMYLQSNCSGYELLFSDTFTGKQITSASEVKDVTWDTMTCTLGWSVQGIWEKGMDGSDINSVCRSHSGHLLATSDDLGKVNIYRYPCVGKKDTDKLSYTGHSSHVMRVSWTVGDEYLLSCGGNDKCLMMWKHVMTDLSSGGGASSVGLLASAEKDDDDDTQSVQSSATDHSSSKSFFLDSFENGLPSGGDEAGAVKPWLGAIRAPKNPPPISAAPPAADLTLQWVHGYTSASAGAGNVKISSNLHYNIDGQVVYPAAALGVLLSRPSPSTPPQQTYFSGHDDDILCMAISLDRKFVATGQTASKSSRGKGSIIIWDAVFGRILSRMDNCHTRAVTSLAFHPDSTQLLSVGQDDNNTHTLWRDNGGGWSKVSEILSVKSDKNPVLFSKWVNSENPMVQSNEYCFVSGGSNGINFWQLDGATLSKKAGRFGKKGKACPLLCAANVRGKDRFRIVVGTSGGDLYTYEERECAVAVEKAHNGPVLCLAEGGTECTFLVSGGKDTQVKVWNQALQPLSVLSVGPFCCVDASIASLDVKPGSGSSTANTSCLILLVGTYGGEILEISTTDEEKKDSEGGTPRENNSSASNQMAQLDLSRAHVEVLLNSHHSGELWGLSPHPLDADIVATAGDDSTVRLWSISKRKMIKCVKVGWPARSLAWHPSGLLLAVGFHESVKGGYKGSGSGVDKKGKRKSKSAAVSSESGGKHEGAVHLYAVRIGHKSDKDVYMSRISQGCSSIAWIGELKFTPHSGSLLLAGSHDKKLYAYSIPDIASSDADNMLNWNGTEWTACLQKPKFVFNKHSSAVLHVDCTLDGLYFQSNCQASELLFGRLENGIQETSASKLADYNNASNAYLLADEGGGEEGGEVGWANQTCKLGWAVQGIWPSGADSSDINAVDRDNSRKYVATADDNGLVKLFRYPCVKEGSKAKECSGHSSHVTSVRWTIGNQLASTGGNDKCLFIWQLDEK